MRGHATPVGRAIENNEHSADRVRLPSEPILDDLRGQATLYVEPANGIVDCRELCLDLDDHDDPACGPNAKDVDGPALTEFRECDLDLEDLPTWLSELAGGHPDQNRVTLIEQPIDLPAAP